MQLAVMGLVVSALAFSECGEDLADKARERLELNGKWQFRLDPDNVGLAQRWFMADADYPNQIRVPGCWQAQGFGPPRGHLRHDYQGKAWYRRAVDVPKDWSGKRISHSFATPAPYKGSHSPCGSTRVARLPTQWYVPAALQRRVVALVVCTPGGK